MLLPKPTRATVDRALMTLMALPVGIHHRGAAGVWAMVGRSLPEVFRWASVPPAPSLSLVWGQGGCDVQHPGGASSVRSGDLLWIDAGCPHQGVGLPDSDFLTLFIPALGLRVPPPAAALRAVDEAVRSSLVVLAASVLAGHATAKLTTIAALTHTLHDLPSARLPRRKMGEARRLIDAAGGDVISVAAVAERMGVSASKLSREFAATWGIPPAKYRRQMQLLEATRRLLRGEGVTRAAHAAGFADTAHLTRTFRTQYGIPPSSWVKLVARPLAG